MDAQICTDLWLKIVVGSSLNHTPRAHVEQRPLVSERKLWYEVTTSIKQSEMHMLANNYFPSSCSTEITPY